MFSQKPVVESRSSHQLRKQRWKHAKQKSDRVLSVAAPQPVDFRELVSVHRCNTSGQSGMFLPMGGGIDHTRRQSSIRRRRRCLMLWLFRNDFRRHLLTRLFNLRIRHLLRRNLHWLRTCWFASFGLFLLILIIIIDPRVENLMNVKGKVGQRSTDLWVSHQALQSIQSRDKPVSFLITNSGCGCRGTQPKLSKA